MPKKRRTWNELRRQRHTEAEIAQVDAEADQALLEMDLAEMRRLAGKTQAQLAEAADMTQGQVSAMEAREDHRVSTLRRVARALGGELEVRFVLGNKSVRLA